jgi:hypothetical protein
LAHKGISDRLDVANGRTRKLEVWQGFIMGAVAVIAFILGYFIVDYVARGKRISAVEQGQAVQLEKSSDNNDKLKEVDQKLLLIMSKLKITK